MRRFLFISDHLTLLSEQLNNHKNTCYNSVVNSREAFGAYVVIFEGFAT